MIELLLFLILVSISSAFFILDGYLRLMLRELRLIETTLHREERRNMMKR